MKNKKGNIAVISSIILIVIITIGVIGWMFFKKTQPPIKQVESTLELPTENKQVVTTPTTAETSNTKIVKEIQIPNSNSILKLPIENDWDVKTSNKKNDFFVSVEPKNITDNGDFYLTLMVRDGSGVGIKGAKDEIEAQGKDLLKDTVEKNYVVHELNGKSAKGYYTDLMTDRALAGKTPKAGKYMYVMSVSFNIEKFYILGMLLSNERDSEISKNILYLIENMELSSKSVTVSDNKSVSIDNATIVSAKNEDEGVAKEYAILDSKYGKRDIAWKLDNQALKKVGDKYYDEMNITLKNGEKITVYFDITSFFGKF